MTTGIRVLFLIIQRKYLKQNNQNAVVFVYNDDLNANPMKINLQTREKPKNLNR